MAATMHFDSVNIEKATQASTEIAFEKIFIFKKKI